MVYPHIISIFNNSNKCDFCNIHTQDIVEITENIGYYCCKSKDCRNNLKLNKEINVIEKEKLISTFGSEINVKRKNGVIESDWIFNTPAYKLSEKTPYIVNVQRNKSFKELTYDDIANINTS